MTSRRAYSYVRFSTPEQARGDSFRRQWAMATKYAADHGLELDETMTFQDRGVSGYGSRPPRRPRRRRAPGR
ncbi:recombinase family protein [Phenylobacterium soli]|uniref:recombinase family protein n=1 Tax=Phenylobacterium soli TaxID=2170551 RepID=UPI001D048E60